MSHSLQRVARTAPGTALALLLGAGCAFGDGEGFATVEPTVQATYALLRERDAGGGWQRLASDYQVRLAAGEASVSRIELLPAVGGGTGAAASFDPASPPPGFTLCHGGHCHAEDGRLVPA